LRWYKKRVHGGHDDDSAFIYDDECLCVGKKRLKIRDDDDPARKGT
jgi:hypothetical protein